MTTATHVFGAALEKVSAADRSIGEAIGALEMAARGGDRELLVGYTGTSALKRLREARKGVQRAKELLAALSPR